VVCFFNRNTISSVCYSFVCQFTQTPPVKGGGMPAKKKPAKKKVAARKPVKKVKAKRCAAKTKEKKQCKRTAVGKSKFCSVHKK